MANTNLPNIVTTLTDGNLNARGTVDLGDRIILIGTAERGPINEPRVVSSISQGIELFGDIDRGNLVRGYSEAYYAPGGQKDIRLVRISNGKVATLDVSELSGSGVAAPDATGEISMSIASRYPGEPYNQGSIRQEVVDGQLSIVFYNPISGEETVIPFDPAGLVENSVSNVEELVNALNLDTNFATDFEANVNYLEQSFTLTLTDNQSWVESSGTYANPSGTIVVDLATALEAADTDGDSLTENTAIVTEGTPVTLANHMVSITEAYSLEDMSADLEAAGKSMVVLPHPCQTTNGVADDFLKLDGTADATNDGRAVHIHVGSFIGTGDGEKVAFEFTSYEQIDGATLHVYRTGPNGIPVEVTGVTLDVLGGSSTDNVAQVTLPAAPPLNHVITADFESLEFPLTKVTTLTAIQASTSYRTYYVAGNKLYFGAAQPADIRVYYKARVLFTDGNEIAISDAENGEITFQDLAKLPNIWALAGANIYMTVKYLPEFPDFTGGAMSLTGGTSALSMTNEEKYDALTDTYTALEDTPADVIVPINCYLDDTKKDFDSETGVETTVNAGFAEQLAAHCEQLLDGVSETFGVIAVKPIVPADGRSVKAADITTYIENLTEFSFSDVTRAANVMRNMDSKHLTVVAFEPVFANQTIQVPYSTSGECLYAGMVAKLPSNSAATNKALSGIFGLNYLLSFRQLNTLTGARYVTAMNRPGFGTVITDDVTAAATTSDWTRRSTFRIVKEAMKGVRRVGMQFIGESFSGARKAALDTAILRHLEGMKQEGKLVDFEWKVTQTRAEEAAGTASVKMILHPAFELRRLEVTVELRQS